jgi:integrase
MRIQSLITLCENHLNLYKGGTLKSWKLFLQVLSVFRDQRGADVNTRFNLENYTEFKNWLIELEYSNNSITNFSDKLKALLRAAGRQGYKISADIPLMAHIQDDSQAIYLTTAELDRIYALKLFGTLDQIRDRFIIGCYTALRFSDYSRINGDNIVDNNLVVLTKKKNNKVVIPMHPRIDAIFRKYRGALPECCSHWHFNKMLPTIGCKARINDRIMIERKIGMEVRKEYYVKHEMIEPHTARRTGATNMYLAGIPTFRIMLITGHRTEDAFFKYIRIRREENANELSKHPFFS